MLKERWPQAQVTGVDASDTMLERTQTLKAGVSWQQADLNTWEPEAPPDLLFSNAALHWLDDHELLFPRLMEHLNPGGVLAVQMPGNHAAPSHTLIREAAGPWWNKIEPAMRPRENTSTQVW